MAFHDASVSVLMDRMSDIDKQRRVLVMRQKELEAAVAFATAEKNDLAREAKAMDDEEAQLKGDLEALAAEEQQLAVQTMDVTDHLRRTEEEETVHSTAATAELAALAQEKATWQEKVAELETLRRTWENDPATSSCIAALRDEMALLTTLKTEMATLEQQKAAMESTIAEMRAEQQAQLASAGALQDRYAVGATAVELLALQPHRAEGPSSAEATSSSDDTAAAAAATGCEGKSATPARSVEEEMKKAEYEWAQVTARHTWAMSSLQREVDALRSRAAELEDLLRDVEATREEVSRRAAQLQQCLTSGLCARCSS
ncbi:hypothetical protein ABB37_02964 [Leptomonas pyrrhocoris]|uniref:Uncharacterized protein n=1 Tax=Leptomonas pyrrhocoris TaxID=157538 RepID=A0A0N0VGC8_LEPPY|nr:hypothetical protein ABB37_02964 [Leptomonas pyrrhocoris]KPA83301.1 hypothetical protein ABB37_02964 [Leptomonas pyrrhocoris]|eukprot:XP_015661740.1 hypothetical protein ABB37_02964 [Leptomonas pyrrhocoris]